MSELLSVRVLLFGAFRELASAGELVVQVPRGLPVKQLRERLAERLGGERAQALLSRSAIGSESEILEETRRIERPQTIALLPPVCGG